MDAVAMRARALLDGGMQRRSRLTIASALIAGAGLGIILPTCPAAGAFVASMGVALFQCRNL